MSDMQLAPLSRRLLLNGVGGSLCKGDAGDGCESSPHGGVNFGAAGGVPAAGCAGGVTACGSAALSAHLSVLVGGNETSPLPGIGPSFVAASTARSEGEAGMLSRSLPGSDAVDSEGSAAVASAVASGPAPRGLFVAIASADSGNLFRIRFRRASLLVSTWSSGWVTFCCIVATFWRHRCAATSHHAGACSADCDPEEPPALASMTSSCSESTAIAPASSLGAGGLLSMAAGNGVRTSPSHSDSCAVPCASPSLRPP